MHTYTDTRTDVKGTIWDLHWGHCEHALTQVPKCKRKTCFPATWIFYSPKTRPLRSSAGSRGDAASSARRAGCQTPHICQLSTTSLHCCKPPGWRQERAQRWGSIRVPPQRIFDSASQLGVPNLLSSFPMKAAWRSVLSQLWTEAASCSFLPC